MLKNIIYTIQKYNMLKLNDIVIIGVSGGADSICLLYLLNELSKKYCLKLIAVHINHCLRGDEALRDENFVKSVCLKLNVKLYVYNKSVKEISKKMKLSEEESGRYIRYNCFNEVVLLEKANKIAIAHNLNDNAETIIMRMSRGTGLKGLKGIQPIRSNIIRPLIETSRKEIELYCTTNNLVYITDSTNLELKYTRNIVRHKIISSIESNLNKNFLLSIKNMSSILSEEDSYIEEQAKEAFKNCTYKNAITNQIIIDISKLKNYHIVIQKRILLLSIFEINSNIKDISKTNIEDIINLLNKQSGKEVTIKNKITVKKSYDKLIINKNKLEIIPNFSYDIELDKIIEIKEKNIFITVSKNKTNLKFKNICTVLIKYDNIIKNLKLRTRKDGDVLKLNNCNKKLKKYFIDTKTPLLERNTLPMLCIENKVICILGENPVITDDYKINATTNKDTLYIKIWELLDEY